MKIVLSIAGSDPSGGAGIQQDLKTTTAMGCYGATVITALTSQNTMGVQDVMPVPAEVVRSQIRSVMTDLDVAAVKIGMIPNEGVARIIKEELIYSLSSQTSHPAIVLDPVMISTSGRRLMEEDCIEYVKTELIPLCTLVTPNLPESKILPPPYVTNFLVKGGHAEGDNMKDVLYCTDGTIHEYSTRRITTRNLHGTGCTLSSAIASALAQNHTLQEAVGIAKDYITNAIAAGADMNIGHGNGPLGVPGFPEIRNQTRL